MEYNIKTVTEGQPALLAEFRQPHQIIRLHRRWNGRAFYLLVTTGAIEAETGVYFPHLADSKYVTPGELETWKDAIETLITANRAISGAA